MPEVDEIDDVSPQSDTDSEDGDEAPLSRMLYSGDPLLPGGQRLRVSAQHAAVRLLETAYRELSAAQRLMQASEEDLDAFRENGVPADAETYGEILTEGILDLLWRAGAAPGMRFYDLGAGAGKAVILAWFLGMRATGVELARSRWEISRAALVAVRELSEAQSLPPCGKGSQLRLPERLADGLDFLYGDMCTLDFRDADVLLVSSIMYPASVIERLQEVARGLKPGARIISYRPFVGSEFRDLGTVFASTSWKTRTPWHIREVVEKTCDFKDSCVNLWHPGHAAQSDRCSLDESKAQGC
eukprot:TRINITY_DN74298_c0_g1_i1.p1 TRINITY_DN74298_c0_g1~~TRINITY_DN74298_c0_g1_i1.p1  ORF type:complete len:300 (-),score=48.93 TRINITY_DN74298_c0_g1_i1:610-1509(-)